jgi:nucleoside-diphosphate-sugar epimerase
VTRILITGAAGFLGAALAARLRADGNEVVGIDRVADPAHGVVAGDTTAPDTWARHLTRCDTVLHTAAVVSNAVDLDEQWRVNVLGTQRVCAAARDAGVPRLVLLSSVRAFSDTGFPDGVTEEHPVRPDGNPYVDTKIASEHVVLSAHAAGEIESVIVRPGDVTARVRCRGSSSHWMRSAAGSSYCRRWAAACTAPSTSTTWSTASCGRSARRSPPGRSSRSPGRAG